MSREARADAACRFCGAWLTHTFVDLGMSPLCESYRTESQRNTMEAFFPLHVFVCGRCYLVQLEQFVSPADIFTEYAYFSSYADSWVRHAQAFVEMSVKRFDLGATSRVIEVASNDGYLLQHFIPLGIPILGIEPAANVAQSAQAKGVPTLVRFFGRQTAEELASTGIRADLLVGNNVLAQVPDLNDFVAGMHILLNAGGVITMEFPHLQRLIDGNQFDTIYHEHFSYFSLTTVHAIFARHGLVIFDVEELPMHGGSLRIYACHADNREHPATERVHAMLAREDRDGVKTMDYYAAFAERVKDTKRRLLTFLIEVKTAGKSIVGYGAPGKGNTLLNYCGIRTDFLDYTVDRNPYKQGKYLPGTHIPIFHPDRIVETKPEYLCILPWNFKDEIIEQMAHIREWGGRFIVPIPHIEVI
ncbi:MAG: class I SAM-dependent methyltransferase [Nitrospirae bacterium]|nr:MAG: class I SAM-dependent methyltransferase [Nitrospirota bacterium]